MGLVLWVFKKYFSAPIYDRSGFEGGRQKVQSCFSLYEEKEEGIFGGVG